MKFVVQSTSPDAPLRGCGYLLFQLTRTGGALSCRQAGVLLAMLLLSLTACSHTGVKLGDHMGTEVFQQAMPEGGEVRDPKHGKEVWFAFGAVEGKEGHQANGVAMAHYFEDDTYAHTAQINIERAAEGYFYEGWVVNPATKNFESTGHLRSHFGDVRHFLKFEDSMDFRDFLKVVITLEPDDGDPAPAAHVAEGLLKVTER
jgi:hypothetical protein